MGITQSPERSRKGAHWLSWLTVVVAGGSCYYMVLLFAYALEISKLPSDRFQGGHGFALNGPIILEYLPVGMSVGLISLVLLAHALQYQGGFKQWRTPNWLTLALLGPFLYGSAHLLLRIGQAVIGGVFHG